MQSSSRREFLKVGGAALSMVAISGLAGAALSCTGAKNVIAPTDTPASANLTFPWPYQKIDPVAAAEAAYAAYYKSGCMYGGFEGIISQLRAELGAPYDSFPVDMMAYGGAGVSGWGTLCGALNGVAAAIALTADPKARNPIINEVFGWYGSTALPDYKPAQPKFEDIKATIANSQLCHISVSKWSVESGFKTTSPERAERCAWLTSSVVKYTVDLLNKQADGTFKAAFAVPASVTGCLSCHGKGGILENSHITNQTTCTDCHTSFGPNHPAVTK